MTEPVNAAVTAVTAFFPCYNDSPTIGGLVTSVLATMVDLGIDGDCVVVNDASPDDSAAVLAALAADEPRLRVVTHPTNRGYGGALRSGFAAADRDWVFYTDGDAQYDPRELALLVAAASDDADVVQGIKSGRGDGPVRAVIGRLYHHTVKLAFGLRVQDTDCDFRLIRRSLLDRVELQHDSGMICVEMMRRFQDAGATFVEVPVSHFDRPHGRSQFLRVGRVLETLRDLAGLWVRLVLLRPGWPSLRRRHAAA